MNYSVENITKNLFMYTFTEKNQKRESLKVELYRSETDMKDKKELPHLWKKAKYIDEVMPSYWHVNTFVKDTEGNCFGKYNPQHKKEKCEIDFSWMLEGTEENKEKILKEIYRIFMESTGKTATEEKLDKILEYAKEHNIRIFETLPEEWKIDTWSLTAPDGTVWIRNNGSIINKTLKKGLLLDKRFSIKGVKNNEIN